MLDPGAPLTAEGAVAWADRDDPGQVWAAPAAPVLARDPAGAPQVSLLTYVRKATREVFGGSLTLTAELRLTPEAAAAVAAAGAEDRERRLGPVPAGEPDRPPVRVQPVAWAAGTMRVRIADGVAAEGVPALYGTSGCVLMLQLDGEQAVHAVAAWDAGLPDAELVFDGTAEAGLTASATVVAAAPGVTTQAGATARTTTGLPVHLAGPVRLSATDRAAARTDIEL